MRFEKQLFLSLAKNLESARGEESNKQRRANKLIDNQRRLYLQFKFLCASSSFMHILIHVTFSLIAKAFS